MKFIKIPELDSRKTRLKEGDLIEFDHTRFSEEEENYIKERVKGIVGGEAWMGPDVWDQPGKPYRISRSIWIINKHGETYEVRDYEISNFIKHKKNDALIFKLENNI